MHVLSFGTLPVGDCFCVPSTLVAHAFDDHLLRKVGRLHAEYVDGSATVLVPEGTLVKSVAVPERLRRAG